MTLKTKIWTVFFSLAVFVLFGLTGNVSALTVPDLTVYDGAAFQGTLFNPQLDLLVNDNIEVTGYVVAHGGLRNPNGNVEVVDNLNVQGTFTTNVGQVINGTTDYRGTIYNSTYDVAIGDNLMVDGYLWRRAGDYQIKDAVKIAGNTYPWTDMKYSLGTSSMRWKSINAGTINGNSLNISGVGSITATKMQNWNEAYNWGDHSAAGYQAGNGYLNDIAALSPVQGDMLYFDGTDWKNLAAGTSGQFLQTQGVGANPHWVTSAIAEVDPVWLAVESNYGNLNQAETILGNWINTANPWALNELVSNVMAEGENISLLNNNAGYVTTSDDSVSGTELDGVFLTTGLLTRTGAGTYSTILDNSTNWNTAYGWGNHATAGYQSQDAYLDDIAAISASQGDILYYNGTHWVNLGAGTNGQYLQTQGAGANPQWATVSGSGDITSVGDGLSGDVFTADGTGYNLYFEGATPDTNEILLTSADPGADYTITLPAKTGTVQLSSYGEMYEDNASGTTITNSGTGFEPWISATSGDVSGGNYVTFTNDDTNGDHLTVGSDGAGKYLVSYSVTYASSNDDNVEFEIHDKSNNKISGLSSIEAGHTTRKHQVSVSGIVDMAATDYVTLYAQNLDDATDVIVYYVNFSMTRIE